MTKDETELTERICELRKRWWLADEYMGNDEPMELRFTFRRNVGWHLTREWRHEGKLPYIVAPSVIAALEIAYDELRQAIADHAKKTDERARRLRSALASESNGDD